MLTGKSRPFPISRSPGRSWKKSFEKSNERRELRPAVHWISPQKLNHNRRNTCWRQFKTQPHQLRVADLPPHKRSACRSVPGTLIRRIATTINAERNTWIATKRKPQRTHRTRYRVRPDEGRIIGSDLESKLGTPRYRWKAYRNREDCKQDLPPRHRVGNTPIASPCESASHKRRPTALHGP